MTSRALINFMMQCMRQCESENFRHFDETDLELVPDEFGHDEHGNIWFSYGDEEFCVSCVKKRKVDKS